LPAAIVRRAERAAQESQPSRVNNVIAVALATLVIWLSIPTVVNLASGRQLMNYSYNALDLVNTYGAFGSVGRERDEIIFEGTDDELITGDTKWKPYEFKAKPGDPERRPPFIAPYQPRIDWQIWFAAMESPVEYPWTLHFVWKLCTTTRARCRCWRITHFQMRRRVTFERGFIGTNSRQSATKHGGDASRSANGCPRFRRTMNSFAGCLREWIGSMSNTAIWLCGCGHHAAQIAGWSLFDAVRQMLVLIATR
jgi:hypothetical protein